MTNNYLVGSDIAISGYYTTKGGKVTGHSTGVVTRTVTVDNLPVGAIVSGVSLSLTAGNASAGGNRILKATCGSVTQSLQTGTHVYNLDGALTGNAVLTITFEFQPNGISKETDGTWVNTIHLTDVQLSVSYDAEQPIPPSPSDAADIPATEPVRGKHIIVYSPGATEFDSMGLAVLRPTECVVRQAAGGEYSLSLEHPITTDGVWRFLTDQAIIKAPIPRESIPYIRGEVIADGVTYTNPADCTRYANTGGSKRVTYSPWVRQFAYTVGMRVTYSEQNYECIRGGYSLAFDVSQWKTISNYTSTAATAAGTTPAGTIITAESVTASWIKGTVNGTGESGYWRASDFELYQEEGMGIPTHDVVEQCFRIQSVVRDTSARSVKVEAMQLTYDWGGSVTTASVNMETVTDPLTLKGAVRAIRESATAPLTGVTEDGKPGIYYETDDGGAAKLTNKVEGDFGYKTVTNCVLDPDNGLVKQTKARLVRDLWSFFLLVDEQTNRGFRIEYGVNMRGVTWTRRAESLVTRIYPRGKDAQGNVVGYTDPVTGNAYIDSSRVAEYPLIRAEALETGVQVGKNGVTAETLQEAMRTVALKRFSEEWADCVEETIEIDFLMLGDTAEYRKYRDLQRVSLYDMVTAVHVPLGLVATAQVKEYEWDAIRLRFNRILLGNPWTYGLKTVVGYDIGNGVIQYEKLSAEAITKIKGLVT